MATHAIVIDLNTCIRCRTCMVACKIQNKIPPLRKGEVSHYRIRPVEWEEGAFPEVRRIFIPVLCMQCDKPACLDACPQDAITKRPDGLVVIDKDKCISCGACTEACPYGVPYLMGKSDKCDFCADARLDKGQKEPYCVKSCPGEAMHFGDMDDPKSRVSQLVASGRAKPLCPEFGTGPHVYYIPPKWYESSWAGLATNDRFLDALSAREKDLAEPATASAQSLSRMARHAGMIASPMGGLVAAVVGAGITLDRFAERKRKVAETEKVDD